MLEKRIDDPEAVSFNAIPNGFPSSIVSFSEKAITLCTRQGFVQRVFFTLLCRDRQLPISRDAQW
jgi:hypothetical protein